jgi:hypothetical protein
VILQVEKLFLSEFGIIINVDFCIDTEDCFVWVCCPWVYLELDSITLVEELVKMFDLIAIIWNIFQMEILLQLLKDFRSNAGFDIYWVDFDS